MSKAKTQHRDWHDEAEKWYDEVEANRARAIESATQAGTIKPCIRWDEPHRYKEMIVNRLSNDPDELSAMATLDGVLQRQIGKYIFFADGRVGQNTTDNQKLKNTISLGVVEILPDTAHKKQVEYYLDRWKEQQPTPTNILPLPPVLDTARARTAIERAITRGWIENAPHGAPHILTWRAIGNRGEKAKLAYFCKCAWLPTGGETIPTTAFDTLFGVNRLDSAMYGVDEVKKHQKWRALIDELFEGLI